MALTSGFFNSIDDDRPYDAEQMSRIFDGIIQDGVYETIGNKFRVTPGDGMSVLVGTGRAWFNHTWTEVDSAITLEVEHSETGLNRIDLVVLEVNFYENTRANSIKILTGTPAVQPERPTLTKDSFVMQYPLASIYVPAASGSVSISNITNLVGTSECPFVIGVLEIMTIDQIVAQWEAQWADRILAREQAMDTWTAEKQAEYVQWVSDQESEFLTWVAGFEDDAESWKTTWQANAESDFNDWFQHLHNELDANQAANLQRQIDDIQTLTTSEIDAIWDSVYGGE